MTIEVKSRDLCDYCELPIPGSWWTRDRSDSSETDGKQFCCFGCRVAAQITESDAESGQSRALLTRLGIAIFLAMNVMVFTMALWSQDVYGFQLGDEATSVLTDLFRYICLLFSIPVLFLLGQPLLVNAIASTRQGRPSTDLLLSVGILAAFGYSALTVFRGSGHLYFEVVCMVLVLVTLGRWIEASGRQRANTALDELERLVPETVQMVTPDGLNLISRENVRSGELLRVVQGERIPLDAEVIDGTAHMDQQILTGESTILSIGPGEAVFSGSLVIDGSLTIRVTSTFQEDTLARLLEVVRQARLKQGSYARLADRVAFAFLPIVIAVAAGTVLWHAQSQSLEEGLLNGLALLLVSCPCALGLATPLAIWNAMGWAARRQVLFREGESLEQLAQVRTICFDKTGTLTTGDARVDRVVPSPTSNVSEVLQTARTLAAHSSHPLCQAILAQERTTSSRQELEDLTEVMQIPGRGVRGTTTDSGARLLLGNLRWINEQNVRIPDAFVSDLQHRSVQGMLTYVAKGDTLLGAITFREELRPEVTEVIRSLQQLGCYLEVLTGDRQARAEILARDLGIPVRGELLPDEKSQRVEQLKARTGHVLMVGDGINDAPALTAADVGLAMGCGTDLARDSAGICLLGNDLQMLPRLLELAQHTMWTVRWNLFWAFGYNTIGIALAAAGKLNPIVAAILMFGSSLFVISNSLRVTGSEQSNRLSGPPEQSSSHSVVELGDAPKFASQTLEPVSH